MNKLAKIAFAVCVICMLCSLSSLTLMLGWAFVANGPLFIMYLTSKERG